MFPLPNTFAPSKKTRDVGVADTIIAMSNARPLVVAAGAVLGPDTLVLLTASNPDTVAAAQTGSPILGTDIVMGATTTYSSNNGSLAGLVCVAKRIPGMTWRIKANTTFQYQSDINAIIGNTYFLVTTTDADGFDHQELDVAGGVEVTSSLKVVDGDYSTGVLLIECIDPDIQ